MVEVSPIGRMRTGFTETWEAPNQGYKANAEGTIVLDLEYASGAADFAVGDTVLILWWAEDADRSVMTVERAEGRSVFTTRSPARPNSICITPCQITAIDGPEIEVVGVDMTDGTPVLDLKPPLDSLGDWDEYKDLRLGYELSSRDSDPVHPGRDTPDRERDADIHDRDTPDRE